MKGSKFSIPNTGKSPIKSSGIAHNSTGAPQPAAYAQQISITNHILNKVMHTRPTKRGHR